MQECERNRCRWHRWHRYRHRHRPSVLARTSACPVATSPFAHGLASSLVSSKTKNDEPRNPRCDASSDTEFFGRYGPRPVDDKTEEESSQPGKELIVNHREREGFPPHAIICTRWAYHAKNSLWYTLLKYSCPSMVHPIFENFDCKMVVVPSRLWLPLFSPCLSRTAGWGASLQHCVQGPCASTAPESRGWKSGSHSQDCTATILLWKFSKMWRCLGCKI